MGIIGEEHSRGKVLFYTQFLKQCDCYMFFKNGLWGQIWINKTHFSLDGAELCWCGRWVSKRGCPVPHPWLTSASLISFPPLLAESQRTCIFRTTLENTKLRSGNLCKIKSKHRSCLDLESWKLCVCFLQALKAKLRPLVLTVRWEILISKGRCVFLTTGGKSEMRDGPRQLREARAATEMDLFSTPGSEQRGWGRSSHHCPKSPVVWASTP